MHTRLLGWLTALLGMCCMAYMTLGATADWGFILPFRGTKLIALIVVAVSISTSTVLFQTITNNRILTPSIMGFDALYVLLLTGSVYALGGLAVSDVPPLMAFMLNTVLMIGVSLLLFGTLLLSWRQDLVRMVLTGVILATLFRSLTSFMQRVIDPNEFAIIQVASFARFNDVATESLTIAAFATSAVLVVVWRLRFRLDVLALGRNTAIGLGANPRRDYLVVLMLISVLVSVSTSLVGPVVFLGLLVVSIAHMLVRNQYHASLLPAAALISAITLVGGQLMLERVFQLATPLSVVVDLVGGLVFLFLVLKGLGK